MANDKTDREYMETDTWHHRLGKLRVGIIDRYIIRKFIGTYLFTILLLVIIVAIFHAVENMKDFIERNASISDILLVYYPTSYRSS